MTAAAVGPDETVGALMKRWRERRRRSQLDLSLAADVSARHLSYIETGRSKPSREMIERLCDELDVPLRERNRIYLAAGFAYGPPDAARPAPDTADQDLVVPLQLRTPYGDLSLLYTATVFGSPRDVTLDEIAIETFFPADAATAQKTPRLPKPRRSTSQPPTAVAPIHPRLPIVMLSPRIAPRASLDTSLRAARSDGRPRALASE